MLKELNKRIEILETIAAAETAEREENAKRLSASIDDCTLTLYGTHSRTVTGNSVLGVVKWLEDYIKQSQPAHVLISLELSGVCDLIPELAETAEGRELDTWYTIHGGSIDGDYTPLLNNGIELRNIIMLESLLPFLRDTTANRTAGIDIHFDENNILSVSHDLEMVLYILYDRMEKWKQYAIDNSDNFLMKPKNRFSKYWTAQDPETTGLL
jgi:hypothetical protein